MATLCWGQMGGPKDKNFLSMGTWQAGMVCFLAKNKWRKASTAACNQASRRVCGATARAVGGGHGVVILLRLMRC